MIKYLFSDIDGTLYVNDDISKDDVKAAHDFVESGGVFSMATGRADLEIVNFARDEQFPKPTFRISANGSMAVDKDEEVIHLEGFSMNAKKLFKAFFSKHLDELNIVEASSPDYIYFLMEPEEWVLNYKEDAYSINAETLTLFENDDFDILKMYIEGDEALVQSLVQMIEADFSDEIDVFNDITAINVGPKNNTKGTGIQKIMDKYGIQSHEIATIGDAANDLAMFDITENSFTFDYSADFVQERATYVVKNVAEAIDIILEKNRKEEGLGE